jgi:uncharacterized SAM-binding protein YcdF (DUF218 family)
MRIALTRLVRSVSQGLAALGLLVLLVTFTPVVSWWARALAGPWTDPTGDVLVVLGGSMLDDGTIGVTSYWRSVYAFQAFREGHYQAVLLSGGDGTRGKSIAESMGDFLRCEGIPAEKLIFEGRSQSTRENALYSRDKLASLPGAKVLVTSDYHMFRAWRTFRKVGLNVQPRPFPDAIKRASRLETRWGAFVDLTRETAAIAYYYARGWI